jgi:hypothetical protein
MNRMSTFLPPAARVLVAVVVAIAASVALFGSAPASAAGIQPPQAAGIQAADVQPPTAPADLRGVYTDGVLTAIAWDPSVFDGHVSYQLFANSTWAWATSSTSVTVWKLVVSEGVRKGSTYTLTVQAIGAGNHLSDLSAPLTVTIPTTVSRP